MTKLLFKDAAKVKLIHPAELEQIMGFTYLPALTFESEKIEQRVRKRSQLALKKDELSIREKWLGVHFKEVLAKGTPPYHLSIRWIDETMGFGVFAEEKIPAHAFLGEYTGKIRKRKRGDWKNDYCFEYAIGLWIRNPFIIDAQDQGNYCRFINHAESPNLESVSIFANGIMHIILVALKPIEKGAQLTYHYGDTFWKKRKNSPS